MRVSPINLKILAHTLDVEGFDARPVLAHCGIASFDALDENGQWVPASLLDEMMAAAIAHTGDPSFGLVAGKSLALMKYGYLTPLALYTPSLRQLLTDLQRFARLAVEGSEIELIEDPHGARLEITPVVDGGQSGHFRMELVATSAVQMLRFAGAGQADILQVAFPYAQPADQGPRYAATFGPCISFEARQCTVNFNAALLDRRFPSHDVVAYTMAVTRAESALAALQAGSGIADTVRQWLLAAFPRQPSVAETAEHLGVSERSLRRQMSMLGTSHAELTQECQRLAAERLLAEGRLPLKQIAAQLGFASVHSFHRAFRRWSGLTPSAWRSGLGGGA